MKQTRARIVATYFMLFILTIFVGFPLFWMVVSSLKTGPDLFTSPPKVLPAKVTLEWYDAVIFRSNSPRLFLNSFIVATVTMIINVVVGALGAYSFTRFRYPGRDMMLYGVLLSYVFPAILLLVPLFLILSSLNLINTLTGIILSHIVTTLPLSLWLLRSFFLDIPREIEHSAMVDGANHLVVFLRITLPLALPGLLSAGLFAFILSWNEYLFASVIGTSTMTKTLPVGIADFVTSFDIRWGEIMALGTVTTIPVIFFFMMIQKHFVRGLTAGAVKG
ncbi:MAG TPA: carbohydrate ABC transporter permease [Bellilinea sp.]|nr:carbohydrate ABC transporter permease [Bellilinea sp.]